MGSRTARRRGGSRSTLLRMPITPFRRGAAAAGGPRQVGMNTRLRAFVMGLVILVGVGTLGTAVATGATPLPRKVMLEKLNHVRAAHGLSGVRPALRLRLAALR